MDDVRVWPSASPGSDPDRGVDGGMTAEVRRLFGLDLDLAGFYRMAKADPALAPLIEPLYGMRPTLAPTAFEMLVGSITAQQVNLSFAFALPGAARPPVRHRRSRCACTTVWAFPEPPRWPGPACAICAG